MEDVLLLTGACTSAATLEFSWAEVNVFKVVCRMIQVQIFGGGYNRLRTGASGLPNGGRTSFKWSLRERSHFEIQLGRSKSVHSRMWDDLSPNLRRRL